MAETFTSVSEPVDGVVTLTIERPEKKNALSIAVRDEISDALGRLQRNPHVKVLVITGAGDVFSAGFDLDEFQRIDDREFADRLWTSSDHFHRSVLDFPLPTVAAVNGPAIAGGFDLAVMCDLRVAVESAFFEHPERTFAEVVFGPLHDLVGGAVARELAFTGRRVGAHEALALRLVSQVTPDGELDDAVRAITDQIIRAPRGILQRMKAKAIRRAGITAGGTLDL